MVKIEISNCPQCPHFESSKVYTEDSWDDVSKWTCKKQNKVISGYVDWNEWNKIDIPKWCPFKEK